MDLPLAVIQVMIQVFEDLKTTVLVLEIESLQEQKCSSGSNSKPTIFFTDPKTPYIYLERLVVIVKILAL